MYLQVDVENNDVVASGDVKTYKLKIVLVRIGNGNPHNKPPRIILVPEIVRRICYLYAQIMAALVFEGRSTP